MRGITITLFAVVSFNLSGCATLMSPDFDQRFMSAINASQTQAPMFRSGGQTSYDPASGNTYTTYQNNDGSTEVYGANAQTGSKWRADIKNDGSQTGWDANGNYYKSTKDFYQNSDGTVCNSHSCFRNGQYVGPRN